MMLTTGKKCSGTMRMFATDKKCSGTMRMFTTDKKCSGTMMRKIDLIVIHCSATRADRSLTSDDLETQHRRRGLTEQDTTITSAKTEPFTSPDRLNVSVRMRKDSTLTR